MSTPDYEKLGMFYLGKAYDLDARQRRADLLLYDARDLVTHAVVVGMTGSGKTGLCMALLEEAAIDSIPAIVIDPKGDLANLLLTFPELTPADFAPWINEDDARRKGVSPADYAQQQADLWRRGLAEWHQDGARIERLRESAEFAVYTPGSTAGLPVSVLRSFSAPPIEIIEDHELFTERVSTTVSSLLGLLGVAADPLQSREHILLAGILSQTWSARRDLDIPGLIHAIQTPPFTKIGVMEVETMFPAKERFGLAMRLNNLLASPGFARWMEGDSLDIGRLLYTPRGKPRVCIFSIAHLGDAERMFFVSLLLNQVLGWVRTQSGTTSLRALLYMDEIAGYFPPVANPPSKRPLLMLMKQARAFGLGVVLATQNPVDLDYKGLSNAGTWFIGRLQTERDKARVLDGLEGAAAAATGGFDRSALERSLSALGNRVFLMNNVHDDGPVIFETRWVMSYLRGPLTRGQIAMLTDPARRVATPASAPSAPDVGGSAGRPQVVDGDSVRPVLPPDIPQYFVPSRTSAGESILYRPAVIGIARVYYIDPKLGIDEERPAAMLAPLGSGPLALNWDQAFELPFSENDLDSAPVAGARYASLPPEAGRKAAYDNWTKSFVDALFRRHRVEVFRSRDLNATSQPGESERDFRARLAQSAREQRDAQVDRLRARYAPKLATLADRIRRAEQRVAEQQQQAKSAKLQTALSFGSALLTAFMGRKVASSGNVGRAASTIRGVSRSMKESGDVGRAEENVDALRQQCAELESALQREIDELSVRIDATAIALEPVTLKPKRSDVRARVVALAWAPYVTEPSGRETPAWT